MEREKKRGRVRVREKKNVHAGMQGRDILKRDKKYIVLFS